MTITQQQALEALERVYYATHASFIDRNLVRQYIEQSTAQALNAELVARVERLEKDAARLDFVCSSPNRMVERESGLWRVYEDVAPTDHPTAVWQGMSTRWHVSPREAIDAAIAARSGT